MGVRIGNTFQTVFHKIRLHLLLIMAGMCSSCRQKNPLNCPDSTKFYHTPPDHIVFAAVDAYFTVCHSKPCTFFHEDKFRQGLDNHDHPQFLLLAIVASTAHLSLDSWFEENQIEAANIIAQTAWTQLLTEVLPHDNANSIAVVQTIGILAMLDFRGQYCF